MRTVILAVACLTASSLSPGRGGAEVPTYDGRAATAAWRLQAAASIEKHRKADLVVVVKDADGQPIEGATVEVEQIRHAFPFGTAVSARWLAAEGTDGDHYRNLVRSSFNKAVLEGDLKWPAWMYGETVAAARAQTFAALRWLRQQQLAVRGHYLAWAPLSGYRPYTEHTGTAAQYRERLLSHVSEKLSAVGDLVTEWDVVNHPVMEDRDTLTSVLGYGFYHDLFRLARTAAPHARLYVNEGYILSHSGERRTSYESFIRRLLAEGIAIDGIGMMGHFFDSNLASPAELIATLDRFASFGLPIQITEFDVRFGRPGEQMSLTPEQLRLQADFTRDFFTVAFSHPAVEGILRWGFWEGQHWYPTAALWGKDWKIKPNGEVFKKLVFEEWWSRDNQKTDQRGSSRMRLFQGTHLVRVRHAGRTVESRITLPKQGATVAVVL